VSVVYLNNRYHDPQLGTFISVDPLVASTGEPYIYASGNPTTLSDPTGLCSSFSGTRESYTCTFYSSDGGSFSIDQTGQRCNVGNRHCSQDVGKIPRDYEFESSKPRGPRPPFEVDPLDVGYLEDLWKRSTDGWDDPGLGVCGGLEGTVGEPPWVRWRLQTLETRD
jgi:hypothetical protein